MLYAVAELPMHWYPVFTGRNRLLVENEHVNMVWIEQNFYMPYIWVNLASTIASMPNISVWTQSNLHPSSHFWAMWTYVNGNNTCHITGPSRTNASCRPSTAKHLLERFLMSYRTSQITSSPNSSSLDETDIFANPFQGCDNTSKPNKIHPILPPPAG